MTPTPALDAMRERTREQDEAATAGPWNHDIEANCGEDGRWGVWHGESGGQIAWVGDPYPRGDNNPFENMQLIAAFRTDAPRYAAMLGVLLEEVAAPCDCNWLAGYHDLPACHIRAALAKIEEMARESR